ncbi:hypothetical protein PFICI_05575 [Pestalotiopsis fici W106-1]|uniref:Pinin/SDK/MemA protein domain-containing protein n=1 Tax=Pestalotiopsis fici (strain W106-1 / CGMCC3.15140) TaxID=1229662 RepID=W3XCF1_PESFW|nr:uncharacterized protein PFICI_05575 [Pestalotiopsis fici W106-1]ETS83699.1 hypothetical protein PFICI_05575 [Pestalotiopsis fici W106-1]
MSQDPATATAASLDASPTTQKRKASSPGPVGNGGHERSVSPKRQRRESESESIRNGANGRAATSPTTTDRRQSASIEEKRRGKRLFGGLLSTLSQTNKSSSQQRKRHDVERRQQARVSQQKTEDDAHREARLAKLKATRQREQIAWEERVLRTKHDHVTNTARFLQTESEPKIYYLPWELTSRQEALIKDQIRDADELVEKETREFKQRKAQRLTALGVPPSKPDSEHVPVSEPAPVPAPDSGPESQTASADPTAEPPTSIPGKVDIELVSDHSTHRDNPTETADGHVTDHASKAGLHQERDNDDTEDIIIKGDEDTVIY